MNISGAVRSLYLKGYSAEAISQRLEADVSKVKKLIRDFDDYWGEKQVAILALRELQVELWEAWQLSKSQDLKNPAGDPRFTAQILSTMDKANVLAGLHAEALDDDNVSDLFAKYLQNNPSGEDRNVKQQQSSNNRRSDSW